MPGTEPSEGGHGVRVAFKAFQKVKKVIGWRV